MDLLRQDRDRDQLRRAYLFQGSVPELVQEFLRYVKKENNTLPWVREETTLSLPALRDALIFAQTAPANEPTWVGFAFSKFPADLEHIFAKFLEDVEGSQIILMVPHISIVPNGLRHLLVYDSKVALPVYVRESVTSFMQASYPSRLAMVEALSRSMKKENADSSKESISCENFLDGCEVVLSAQLRVKNKELGNRIAEALKEILHAKKLLRRPGASPSLILEHLALVVPIINPA